ncbi:cytochrome c [bacterium BMS3Abin04]|nr:cytochrome c [bacterium BMS3Abin04]
MNFKKSKIKYLYYFLLASLIALSFGAQSNNNIDNNKAKLTGMPVLQSGKWKAPALADNLKNPIKDIIEASKKGKKIFSIQCAICHGKSGKGDGMAGMALNPRPANLTSKKVQEQSDGAIFWKLTTGKPPMASYAKIYSAKQRWQLVSYIRTLGKKK